MGLIFTLRTAELSAQIDQLIRVTGKGALEVVLQEGKLLNQDLVKLTPPFGSAPSTESFNAQRKVGEKAVERDVRKTFTVLDLEKIKSERLRERLKLLARKGDLQGIESVLRGAGFKPRAVLREVDPALHARLRDGRGRIRGEPRVWVVSERSVNKYVRLMQSHVGKAKAGFAAAAQALGVRLPAWITRHGTGGGSFTLGKDPHAPKITIRNAVPYIQLQGAELRVVQKALANRTRNIKARLEKIARSGWRKK